MAGGFAQREPLSGPGHRSAGSTMWTCRVVEHPVLRSIPPVSPSPIMRKLTPAVQRLILAFTTGLFLACAAHVSGQGAGPMEIAAPY
jgi:hypothetical protein